MKLMAATVMLAGLLIAVPAAAANRLVDDNLVPCVSGLPVHATIGAAVAAAAPGETILVCAGTYFENVIVNKTNLTLQAQGVVRLRPGDPNDPGITVAADGVTIQGFDISGPFFFTVLVVGANRANIRDNRIHDNWFGIIIDGGTDHRIRYNVIEGHLLAGIAIQLTSGPVEVSNNTAKNNADAIIAQECQDGLTIAHNALTGNAGGILAHTCHGALITNNTVRGTGGAGVRGIFVYGSDGVVVTRNLVQDAATGVGLELTTGATASFNSISSTEVGLDVKNSTGATVTRNNVSRSTAVDCRWDGTGANVLTNNNCGTQQPAGAFD